MDGFPLGQFSVATGGWLLFALLALGIVTSIIKGKVVPRTSLDDAIHDRDEWRAESRIKDAQIAEKDSQLRHLAEVGETQKSVLSALSKLTGQARESR
jgi:hypothetical protein